jgi:hypothetical protein
MLERASQAIRGGRLGLLAAAQVGAASGHRHVAIMDRARVTAGALAGDANQLELRRDPSAADTATVWCNAARPGAARRLPAG